MEQRKGVDGAALCLPEPIRIQLTSLSPVQKSRIEEFRFRLGQPIAAVTKDGMRYLQGGKLLPFQRQAGLYLLSRKDLESIFFALLQRLGTQL